MATRYVSVLAFAAIAAFCALILIPQGARATLVSVRTCDGGSITLNPEEKRVLELHNKARKKRGLKALCVHPILTEAARAHTEEMLDREYFSHDSFSGETLGERLERFGYTSSGYSSYYIGENISWGCGAYGSPDSTFKRWMHSSVHRANILWKRFRDVGIGVSRGAYGECNEVTMYTVDFGVRQR